MALYFTPFPTIPYRIPGTNRSIAATDITRRFAVRNFIFDARVAFDTYYVDDGERPDTVAKDYYQDPTLDWLVLLTNEIQDPYFEWPLGYEQFNKMVLQKYKGRGTSNSDLDTISYVNQTIHHYERIIQSYQTKTENGIQRIIPEKTLTVDYTTYLTLPAPNRRAVTIYEYEVKLNDYHRNIYLLDLNFVDTIREQHPYIFDEGSFIR